MSTARPPAPAEQHEGFEFVAVPEDDDWRLIDGGDWPGGRCRMGSGMGHRACRKPAVAALRRSRRAADYRFGSAWWAYCADHMYGRWIEDGQVMYWVLREVQS